MWQLQNVADVGITPACAGKSAGRRQAFCNFRDHPRLCGEKSHVASCETEFGGSPPLARGKDKYFLNQSIREGITPAYAGKSWRHDRDTDASRDHPRLRGEKIFRRWRKIQHRGSLPLTRGKGLPVRLAGAQIGITPAYAGKSYTAERRASCLQDHPRLRGEKVFRRWRKIQHRGSLPLTRGKGLPVRLAGAQIGITPACAGKRSCHLDDLRRLRDHPRLRGEKALR